MIGQSDARLAARVRAGDERAFELLVRRHRPALVSYCRRLGLDGRAEDAVQLTFLSAWLALRRGQEVRDVRSWLGRIAHNKAVDLLRAGVEAPGEASSAGAVPGGFEQGLELRQTLAAVAALPSRQRDALLLSAVDGRSYEEVASALGLSEGAVRGLLHRARATLRAAAGALAPLPLMRRAWMPVGRATELVAPNGAGGAAGGAWRAAAAAVTTVALAAGVAVGPLHNLIAGHARHRGAHAAHVRSPTRAPAGERSVPGTVARGAVSGARAQGSAPNSGRLTRATARAPVPAGKPTVQSPISTRPQTVAGATPPEPGPAAAAPTSAAVASAPGGQANAEGPASTPAPETPPVSEQPEAAKPPETHQHEEQPSEHEEQPPDVETERTPSKDN